MTDSDCKSQSGVASNDFEVISFNRAYRKSQKRVSMGKDELWDQIE